MRGSTLTIIIVISVLILDQALKFWIKTNFNYGDELNILGLNWARIHFVENEGMAFGISFGGKSGKLALSLFRLLAVVFLVYLIRTLIRSKESRGLLVCFALILAGAIGNILDSAFYGLIFSESSYTGPVAQLFPENGGYAGFLHGRVVDMLYFPMVDTHIADWIPVWGGERFKFFKPVFNIADSAITTGVLSMIVFYRGFLRTGTTRKASPALAEVAASDNTPAMHAGTEEE